MAQVDNGSATMVTQIEFESESVRSTHNVAVDAFSGFLYRISASASHDGLSVGSSGLLAYSLVDPAQPELVGWGLGEVHDAQVRYTRTDIHTR
jgi:hypothetical protein